MKTYDIYVRYSTCPFQKLNVSFMFARHLRILEKNHLVTFFLQDFLSDFCIAPFGTAKLGFYPVAAVFKTVSKLITMA